MHWWVMHTMYTCIQWINFKAWCSYLFYRAVQSKDLSHTQIQMKFGWDSNGSVEFENEKPLILLMLRMLSPKQLCSSQNCSLWHLLSIHFFLEINIECIDFNIKVLRNVCCWKSTSGNLWQAKCLQINQKHYTLY